MESFLLFDQQVSRCLSSVIEKIKVGFEKSGCMYPAVQHGCKIQKISESRMLFAAIDDAGGRRFF